MTGPLKAVSTSLALCWAWMAYLAATRQTLETDLIHGNLDAPTEPNRPVPDLRGTADGLIGDAKSDGKIRPSKGNGLVWSALLAGIDADREEA